MKLIICAFTGLLILCVGCSHTGVKKQTEKMNGKKVKPLSSLNKTPNLDDYLGTWEVEKKTYGCFSIKIEKGSKKDTIKMTRKSEKIMRSSAVNIVSKVSSFDSPPQNTISDYYRYNLFSSSIYKFIRGKIVSAHIWTPNTNDWLGVGVRTWTLNRKGALIKKKAGLTMQSSKLLDPKEKMQSIFNFDKDDILGKWEIECKYIKSSKK